jgi:hypothetical protein
MRSATSIRLQIESQLARKVPSALSPRARTIRPVAPTGIAALDEVLQGGLPIGAVSELVGPEGSGRTSVALSFVSRMTQAAKVCAWIDVSNTLHPESASAAGVDLSRLLWIRCGVMGGNARPSPTRGFVLPEKYLIPRPAKKGLHGGGFGPHPRDEVKGLSEAVGGFLRQEIPAPRSVEPERRVGKEREISAQNPSQLPIRNKKPMVPDKPWSRIEQALRVSDLLLQAGGFSAVVLDMGSIAPEHALRVPSATWFRYRAAAEQSQTSILLLTQHVCAKSSAGLVLRLEPGDALRDEPTVFTGVAYRVSVERERFQPTSGSVIPLRKPAQRETNASWQSRTPWAGRR